MNQDKMVLRNGRPAILARRDDPRYLPPINSPVDEPFSLAEITGVLRRRKWLILSSITAWLLLALAASLVMTPKYESVSVIEINKENSDALGLENAATEPGQGGDSMEHTITMETHASAVQSDTLALQVIDQLHLDARPEFQWKPSFLDSEQTKREAYLPLDQAPHRREKLLKVFHKNLTVKQMGSSRLMEIRYLNPDAQVAAAVANTLANDYMEEYFQTRYTATAQASDWLSKQLADLKTQVAASRQKLVDYQKQNGMIGIGTDGAENVVMAKLVDLNKQLTEAQGNRITRQVIHELVKSGNAELISGLAGNSFTAGSSSPVNSLNLLQTLRGQEAELKIQYAEAATKFGSAYPKLVEMGNQLDALNAAIQNEIQKVGSRAENDYLTALMSENMLHAAFEKQKAEANNLNDKAIQYTILKHEADSSNNLYDELLEKLKSAGILSGLRSTKLLVIDPARPTAEPVRPNFLVNHAIGLFAGLLLGVALAFIKESGDTTIRNPSQIETVTLLPQLGHIPDFRFNSLAEADQQKKTLGRTKAQTILGSNSKEIKPLAVGAPHSSIADAYRQVRSSITLSDNLYPKVLLVTSPSSAEGKTTTAINLSVVLAQQGARVLLVDADLRRPSVQSRLQMASGTGLGSLLTSKNGSNGEIVEYPDQPGLFVLGAGSKVHYAAELLGSKKMGELIEHWRGQFDVVLIDTSPVLSVTDAVVLSSRVDGVLLVVRSEATTKQSLLRARDVLFRANAKISGFIVNAVDLNSWDYQQYYG
jgi:polysaccharide biosynthesis transport protein